MQWKNLENRLRFDRIIATSCVQFFVPPCMSFYQWGRVYGGSIVFSRLRLRCFHVRIFFAVISFKKSIFYFCLVDIYISCCFYIVYCTVINLAIQLQHTRLFYLFTRCYYLHNHCCVSTLNTILPTHFATHIACNVVCMLFTAHHK